MISYDDFKKIDLRVAKILEAERIEGSEKLVKLQVDTGGPSTDSTGSPQAGSGQQSGIRQIVAGIGTVYTPEILVGKQIIIVANLEPKKLMGFESNGMLLAANDELGPVLLCPESEVKEGTEIK